MRPAGTVGIRSESQRLMATRSREGGQGAGGHPSKNLEGPAPRTIPESCPPTFFQPPLTPPQGSNPRARHPVLRGASPSRFQAFLLPHKPTWWSWGKTG